jgi:hypothetical protein
MYLNYFTFDMYSIIWKYKIGHKFESEFENEYGRCGSWNKFFGTSGSYLGSYLNKSEEDKYIYILIDTWVDRSSHDDFMTQNTEAYKSLSKKFENIYISEELIGGFESID